MADVGVQFLRRLMVYLIGQKKKNPILNLQGFPYFLAEKGAGWVQVSVQINSVIMASASY
jgi:hypothetical protein